jgi:predicted nucleic acid-binding protein
MACRLVEKYPLGAADALQLAAAMVWWGGQPTGHAFLCTDKRLSEAARAAGFSVIEL